jgi:hypothetical protein
MVSTSSGQLCDCLLCERNSKRNGNIFKETRLHVHVALYDSGCRWFLNIRAKITYTPLDCQDDNATHHGELETRRNRNSNSSDERLWG